MIENTVQAEDRIRRVIASKNVGAADCWRTRGKGRFARELPQDGVPPDEAAALLDLIDGALFPPVDLGELLRDMKERTARSD